MTELAADISKQKHAAAKCFHKGSNSAEVAKEKHHSYCYEDGYTRKGMNQFN